MKNSYFLSVLLSLFLFPFAAQADDEIVYDVSGDAGGNGGSVYGRRDHGLSPGPQGGNAEDGQDAGSIDAEVGFVPGTHETRVYIRGTKVDKPGERPSRFDEVVDTEDLKSILFQAIGGKGGDGGNGGPGEPGQRGRDGQDQTYVIFGLDGADGKSGENGSDGGNGGHGGRGGNAGRVRVKLGPDSELLSPMIRVVARPGAGGRGGAGGEGGEGGKGGEGGEGICEDGSRNDFVFGNRKDVPTNRRNSDGSVVYTTILCGSDGRDDSAGKDGRDGNRGNDGQDGAGGEESLAYADGRKVNGGYKLRATEWVIQEAVNDGLVEPKEDLRATGVVFQNAGKDPVPAADYNLDLPEGKKFTVRLPALPAGGRHEVKLDAPVALEAPAKGAAEIPLEVRLNHLNPGVEKAPTLPIKQPVEITQVNDLQLTSLKREGEIVFRVVNNANKAYGEKGAIGRKVQIQLNSRSGTPPLVKVDGKFRPLNEAFTLDIPEIKPGEVKLMRVKVRAPENWKPGQEAKLSSSLSIAGSKVPPVENSPTEVAYQIDLNDKFSKNFRVADLGVTCQYYRALWFNYGVESISVIKSKDASQLEVRVGLAGGKMSPVYRVDVKKGSLKGFLANVLNERPFDSNQLVEFIQSLDHPGYRGVFSDGSRWNVRSCYAAENRRGEADPESYAAEQASRINSLNDPEEGENPRVLNQFTSQKQAPGSGGSEDAPAKGRPSRGAQ